MFHKCLILNSGTPFRFQPFLPCVHGRQRPRLQFSVSCCPPFGQNSRSAATKSRARLRKLSSCSDVQRPSLSGLGHSAHARKRVRLPVVPQVFVQEDQIPQVVQPCPGRASSGPDTDSQGMRTPSSSEKLQGLLSTSLLDPSINRVRRCTPSPQAGAGVFRQSW